MKKLRYVVALGAAIVLVGGAVMVLRQGPRAANTIVVGLSADITTFEPANISSRDNMNIAHHIFDSLFELDADGTHVPSLAREMAVSEDGLAYTYTLREGLTCHDGEAADRGGRGLHLQPYRGPGQSLHRQRAGVRLHVGRLHGRRGARPAARAHHHRAQEPDRVRPAHRDQHPLQGQLREDEPRSGRDRAHRLGALPARVVDAGLGDRAREGGGGRPVRPDRVAHHPRGLDALGRAHRRQRRHHHQRRARPDRRHQRLHDRHGAVGHQHPADVRRVQPGRAVPEDARRAGHPGPEGAAGAAVRRRRADDLPPAPACRVRARDGPGQRGQRQPAAHTRIRSSRPPPSACSTRPAGHAAPTACAFPSRSRPAAAAT